MKNYLLGIVKTVGENVYVLLVRFAWWGFANLHQQQTGSVLKQYFAAACVLVCIITQQTANGI